MHNGLDLQLQLQTASTESMPQYPKQNLSLESTMEPLDLNQWTGAFNTSILTTRAQETRDPSQDLALLMKTPEFECLLIAAQHLAVKENLSQEEATERLIETFRNIDRSWREIVMARGLKSLTGSA